MATKEEKRLALAEHLGIDESEIEDSDYDENLFTYDDMEYLVLDDKEADNATYNDIEELIDDMGLEAFSENMQNWILENAIDYDFEEAYREMEESYVEDIENEGSSGFKNRLIEEMYAANILTDDDFNEYKDDGDREEYEGNVDLESLKDDVDLEEKKEEYVDYLLNNISDFREEFIDEFGIDEVLRLVKEGYATLDTSAIVDEVIRWDGRGPSLAQYDGEERELDNDLFAYRVD